MLWFLVQIVWSHPFDVDFFGHDLQIDLKRESLEVEYVLEVPFTVLKEDVRRFGQKVKKKPGLNRGEEFLDRHYAEIQDELQLQIDGENVDWSHSERVYFR